MYESPFFDKVAGHRSAILLNKRLWHRCFNVNFVKFLRTLKKKHTLRQIYDKSRLCYISRFNLASEQNFFIFIYIRHYVASNDVERREKASNMKPKYLFFNRKTLF